MNKIWYINEVINSFVWGKYMIFTLLFLGIWLLIQTRFFPLSKAIFIFKKTVGSLCSTKKQKGQVTSLQAVSTALAGTLGVGSIIGVSTALVAGGPGALFWMWISAFLGMMIKYSEVVLAIQFRKKEKKQGFIGGAMVTLEHGCNLKFLAVLFSLFCIFASFGIGNLAPTSTITSSIQMYINAPSLLIGIVIATLIALIIIGNVKKIMRVNEIIIPIMSILYIFACIYLIMLHQDRFLQAIISVFKDAFHMDAAIGGIGGFVITKAIHYGISRGIFSHEAGMGSSPISYASVSDADPMEQGCWGIFEVFFDTFVICTLTAFVILTSGLLDTGLDGASLSIACFEQGFGKIGGFLFALSIISFAIPSILGWYYYAQSCIRYIFTSSWVLPFYQCLFLVLLIFGSQLNLHYVWELADTLNGLMMLPNLISIFILRKNVVKLTRQYKYKLRSD